MPRQDEARQNEAFFDEIVDYYHADHTTMQKYERVAARSLEARLAGRVLAVGGIWGQASKALPRCSLTVCDLSRRMLRREAELHPGLSLELVRADVHALPFAPASFDHVVVPLLLHHLASGSARLTRASVRRALASCARVVAPGGRLWVLEHCTSLPVYAAQLALSRVTQRALRTIGSPHVVMHSERFLRGALESTGLELAGVVRARPADAKVTDMVAPLLAAPRLRIPMMLYPIRLTLLEARAA